MMGFRQRFKDGVRVFNKHLLNPLMRRVAERSVGPFAIVRHVGRRSGRPYETPIIVVPVTEGFVIALTYGLTVDWYRNVVAAGGCVIRWKGQDVTVDGIESLTAEAGWAMFPTPERQILRLLNRRDFVLFKRQVAICRQ